MKSEFCFLYVEDDQVSRDIMEILLKRVLGYDNIFFLSDSSNIEADLNQLEPKPNVIFLDIHLKPYNGFEILTMIRDHPAYKNAIVIALTASVMNEEVEKLHVIGFDGGLAKPLDMQAFPELLTRILARETVWHIH